MRIMNKIMNFLPSLFMLSMIIMFFNIYGKDMAGMNTELMLSGTSKSPPVVKMIVIGLFLAAMLCIPTFCLMINEHRVIPVLYCIIVLLGTIIGKEDFWELIMMGFCLFGAFFATIAEVAVWIIRLFFPGFNGAWVWTIAQVIGHGLTVSILCFPIEALEQSESSNSTGRGSYSGGSPRDINYNEELREMREKEQLETLKRIERDLRYK